MKGDFTRDTFDPAKHHYRVLMQQGRVQLDADWNEQVSITLHRLEMLARDLIGPFGTPAASPGFSILSQDSDGTAFVGNFGVGAGRFYVNGMLCENDTSTTYSTLAPDAKLQSGKTYLAFLDVWEQYISAVEEPSIREPALGGSDTAGRSKINWQIGVAQVDPKTVPADFDLKNDNNHWDQFAAQLQPENRGWLKAHAKTSSPSAETPPEATPAVSPYRGAENQLYRVEVHTPGPAGKASFKWSRENGSVLYGIKSFEAGSVTLSTLGRDERLRLKTNDWVELLDDNSIARNLPGPLMRVTGAGAMKLQVSLRPASGSQPPTGQYRFLRRWDFKPEQGETAGALPIQESSKHDSGWVVLEDGIEVQFQPAPSGGSPNQYSTGDYWLIPARVATGGIEWPSTKHGPVALRPRGINHSHAPLAVISLDGAGIVTVKQPDCRFIFFPLVHP